MKDSKKPIKNAIPIPISTPLKSMFSNSAVINAKIIVVIKNMKNFIYKFLIVALIGLQSTFGMAETASLLPNGMQTFLDANGHPLTSGTVDFFIPATSTRKNTWKEATETNLNLNPVVLDAGGRAVIYGFGDYRQVVKDRNGNTIWDKLTSSTGTGSGSATSVGDGNIVGTVLPWSGFVAPPNYVFAAGQEIARVTFPEFLAAVTSVQAVFCTSGSPILTGIGDTTQLPIGGDVEATCLPTATTIISKTANTVTLALNANATSNIFATFYPWGNGNSTTTFNVPDFRGYVLAGRDNMGGTAANRLTTSVNGFGVNASAIGATGGSESETLTVAQIPSHSHTITDPGHIHTATTTAATSAAGAQGGAGANQANGTGAVTVNSATTGITATNNTGGGTAHPIVQPTITTNYIVKVTPDTSTSIATGVFSIGGMTGVIACGSGLTCTSNTVSLTNPSALTNVLTSAHLFVGNGSNLATDVALSGDCSLANTGAITCFPSPNVQTINYTIQTTDCGGIVQSGTGTTGYLTVTLPAVGGFPTKCTVTVKNGDTARAKKLSGFPADLPVLTASSPSVYWLGPSQTVQVSVLNGAWKTTINPGRYKQTGNLDLFVDTTSGSDNGTTDGLSSASAFLTWTQAYNVAQQMFDLQGFQTVANSVAATTTVTTGITLTGPLIGGKTTACNAPFAFKGAGKATTTIQSTTAAVQLFQVQGGAQIQLQSMKLKSSGAGGNIMLVNSGLIMFGDVAFDAAGNAYGDAAGPDSKLSSIPTACGSPTGFESLTTGNANIGFVSEDGALITLSGVHTVSGTPAFTTAFVQGDLLGGVDASGYSFSGAGATGPRYRADGGWIFLGGSLSTTFFPGNAAGVQTDGGWYANQLKQPNVQVFLTGTNATYTTPSGTVRLIFELVGGGGGGAGSGTTPGAATAGGDTCVRASGTACTTPLYDAGGGALGSTATSGSAAGGTISGTGTCDETQTGGNGGPASSLATMVGGEGGSSRYGGQGHGGAATAGSPGQVGTAAAANSGSGGGGAGVGGTANTGGGGGSGAWCQVAISAPSASYSYTVGAAGAAGTAGTNGGAGGAGAIGKLKATAYFND